MLSGAGVRVLDRSWAVEEVDGASVGIVGLKGFVGGFPDSQLPDFGEPILRQVYAETTAEVDGARGRASRRSRAATTGSSCCTTRRR